MYSLLSNLFLFPEGKTGSFSGTGRLLASCSARIRQDGWQRIPSSAPSGGTVKL
jgi:hypothetical protein